MTETEIRNSVVASFNEHRASMIEIVTNAIKKSEGQSQRDQLATISAELCSRMVLESALIAVDGLLKSGAIKADSDS